MESRATVTPFVPNERDQDFEDDFELSKILFILLRVKFSNLPQQILQDPDFSQNNDSIPKETITSFVSNLTGGPTQMMTTKDEQMNFVYKNLFQKNFGFVSWENFRDCLKDWLIALNVYDFALPPKEEIVLAKSERLLLHYHIAIFFLQDAPSGASRPYYEKMNSIIDNLDYGRTDFDYLNTTIDFMNKEDKLAFYDEVRNQIEGFAILTSDFTLIQTADSAINALRKVVHLLNILTISKYPNDLVELSPTISRLLDLILHSNILGIVFNLIANETNSEVLWECLKILTFLFAASKINNVAFQGRALIERNLKKIDLLEPLMLKLKEFISSTCIEIKNQSLLLLGFMAMSSVDLQPLIYTQMLPDINDQINEIEAGSNYNYLILASWLGAVLARSVAGSSPQGQPPEHMLQLMNMASRLSNLLTLENEITKNIAILCSVALPYGGIDPQSRFLWEKLIYFAQQGNSLIKRYVLMTIKTVITSSDVHCQFLVNELRLCHSLNEILVYTLGGTDESLKILACETALIVARKGFVMQIVESGLLSTCNKIIFEKDYAKILAMRLIRILSASTPAIVSFLVENGTIKSVAQNLVNGKEFDDVLTQVYSYTGHVFNVPYLVDSLLILGNILAKGAGFNPVTSNPSNNIFADFFDIDFIEKLRNILEEIINDEVLMNRKAYFRKNYNDTLDNQILALIFDIKNVHTRKNDEYSKPIVQFANKTLEVLAIHWKDTKTPEFLLLEQTIDVKCYFPNEEIRLFEVPKAITKDKLTLMIQAKYNMFGGFVLKYVNNSNEKITIDSDLVLQKAFDEALIQGVQNGRRAEITILVMIMNANGLPFSPFPNALATPTRSEVDAQCWNCGRIFRGVNLIENYDPNTPFTCWSCRTKLTPFKYPR